MGLFRHFTGLAITVALGLAPVTVDTPKAVTDTITDPAGVLGARRPEVQTAIDQLEKDRGIRLYVVYVDTFSGANASTWADDTAEKSRLGRDDLLLAVATGERRYAISADTNAPVSDAQIQQVSQQTVVPALKKSDWAGAAIGAAQGFDQVLAPGSGGTWVWVGLAVLVLAGLGLYFYARRRRRGQESKAREDLEARAGQALVRTDDAVKTSEQEVGFAEAQFGEEAAKPFAEALAFAKGELDQAFRLRQQLDDEVPEDAATSQAMLEEIVRRCEAANARLDAESDAFDKLRDLEKQAPQVLAHVEQLYTELAQKVGQVRQVLADTAQRYAASALTPVEDNPGEATSRLDFAHQTLKGARAALEAGESGQAVAQVLAAQSAVDQARQLLEAVTRRADDIDQAAAGLKPALEAIAANLSGAKALAADARFTSDLASQIAFAESTATQVANEVVSGPVDPITLLRRVEEAQRALDQALSGVRDKQAREEQARGLLDQALLTARSEIAATKDFITTNRGAVGSTARTRLAEAERLLAQATKQAAADPVGALAAAQRADQLAQEAGRSSRGEAAAFGAGRGGSGQAMMGAVLGGILIEGMLGGGGGGGGGGGRRPARAPGRAPAPGSFGGSRTRGRRGAGGAF